jgi:hypothetical protein
MAIATLPAKRPGGHRGLLHPSAVPTGAGPAERMKIMEQFAKALRDLCDCIDNVRFPQVIPGDAKSCRNSGIGLTLRSLAGRRFARVYRRSYNRSRRCLP